ncbi:hypothetical protein RI129_002918 [Pyrocoelia pectoralis]|uniref:Uncharacterized protein n=1 Tax=Pyrocoelia pectoralis TaxID=417401 RepID=A0AAN7VMU0_9COLE
MLKKAEYDNKDPHMCLLEYRATPIDSNLPSPAKLLFNRDINSLLPKFNIADRVSPIVEHLSYRQAKQKNYFDLRTKELCKLLVKGENVRVQKENKTCEPGKIVDLSNKPRTYVVKLENGSVLERNRKYLIRDSKTKKPPPVTITNTPDSRPKRSIQYPKKCNEFVSYRN